MVIFGTMNESQTLKDWNDDIKIGRFFFFFLKESIQTDNKITQMIKVINDRTDKYK